MAYVAHVVGFAVGFVLTVLFVGEKREAPEERRHTRRKH